MSEWHPIIRYGSMHDWRRIVRYSGDLELDDAWGNLVGFHPERSPDELQRFALSALEELHDMIKQVVVRHESQQGSAR